MRTLPGQLLAALRALVVLTVLLGVIYPLAVLGVGQAAFGGNADGSLVHAQGRVVGSDLIGQSFADPQTGAPLARYFQPRPSAAGDGYDPTATAGSNLGPESEKLLGLVRERGAALGLASPPPDAVTASFSGLDPHISPAYARAQVNRVAAERGLEPARVLALVTEFTQGRTLGFLGERRVNVLRLNLALDALTSAR